MLRANDEDGMVVPFRFHQGDRVHVVQGVDTGRSGVIVSVNPRSARPYQVKLAEGWYVHFAEDRLEAVRSDAMVVA
jgi:ribosomal protein S4E